MLKIPESSSGTPETAKSKFLEALEEEDTIFLLFRNNTQNESQIQDLAAMADNVAQQWAKEVYRVVLINNQALVNTIIAQYFGDDNDVVAVSLCFGKGEPRKIGKKYILPEIDNERKIGMAFSNAKQI